MTTFESKNSDDVQAQETDNIGSEKTANKSEKAVKLSDRSLFIVIQEILMPLTLAELIA